MKNARQINIAIERLDQSLYRLRGIIKRGQINEALQYMDEGDLKDKFEELTNIINISQTNPLGSRGTTQTGRL
jgi:hypothetical protein|tara:strand:+ start:388 stop:606 length:219 start_codon:yes stop_codon:yes gene_type:complete